MNITALFLRNGIPEKKNYERLNQDKKLSILGRKLIQTFQNHNWFK